MAEKSEPMTGMETSARRNPLKKQRHRLLCQLGPCVRTVNFSNILRFEVVESAGIEFRKSSLLNSFQNGNKELYTG